MIPPGDRGRRQNTSVVNANFLRKHIKCMLVKIYRSVIE